MARRTWVKIARILGQVTPGLILADRPEDMREILDATGSEPVPVRPLADLSWIEAETPVGCEEHAAARRAVGPDTVAKLLFTSGSTGSPKAVVNTQRMMVSNMLGLRLIWPFLAQRPPRLVDWLPWNHTFGGNCNFNIALFFGGSLHIDDGKPTPALVRRTVDALRENPPSVYFNVPGGYEALLPHLQDDAALSSRFFGGLDFLFNAAAPMPAALRERIEAAAVEAIGRVPPIVGGWGATETAPFSTAVYFDNRHAANLGVPLPGTEIKLVPSGGRYELRVRGPNVMPGYWRDPPASAAAFDEEGFYRIGDAGRLVDPERPALGILFDGRTAENFKLSSGTWVNVGALRVALVSALQPLVSDVVVTGEGRDELGALLFMNVDACRRLLAGTEHGSIDDDELPHPVIREALVSALRVYNDGQTGSSLRITRFHVLAEGPSPLHDEITEKGYINQRAVLRRRIDVVERLHCRPCDV